MQTQTPMSDNAPNNKQDDIELEALELKRFTSEEQDLQDNKNIDSILSSIFDACVKNEELPLNYDTSYTYIVNEAKDVDEETRRFIRDNKNKGRPHLPYHYIESLIDDKTLSKKTNRAFQRIIIMERCKAGSKFRGFDGGHLFAIRHSFNSLLSFNKLKESQKQQQLFKKNYKTLLNKTFTLAQERDEEREYDRWKQLQREEEDRRRRRRRQRKEEEEEEERRRRRRRRQREEEEEEDRRRRRRRRREEEEEEEDRRRRRRRRREEEEEEEDRRRRRERRR